MCFKLTSLTVKIKSFFSHSRYAMIHPHQTKRNDHLCEVNRQLQAVHQLDRKFRNIEHIVLRIISSL